LPVNRPINATKYEPQYYFDMIIDGSHNEDSVAKFLSEVKEQMCEQAFQENEKDFETWEPYGHNVLNSFDHGNPELCVLFGAGKDKCTKDMLKQVCKYADKLVLVQSTHFNSLSESELYELLPKKVRSRANYHPDNKDPYRVIVVNRPCFTDMRPKVEGGTIREHVNNYLETPPCRVLAVCGSLFVAAEAREWLFKYYPELFAPDDWVRYSDNFSDT
jgi:folylpolyglutamate synthase/dihydropteroate synthase